MGILPVGLIACAMLRSVLRDSGFDSSIDTINYGVTSSDYFGDMTLEEGDE
jgi:hypothetical protein